MIGTRIFNYRIIRLIGEGGMAKVYEAIHEKFENRRVAIKILDPVLTANADIRHRFENEAKIMASLDHPNIVKVMDYTDESDRLAIVMEYLEGYTLSDYVKKFGSLSPKTVGKLMVSILHAFQYAHEHGIIHRDVKPSNILLDDQLNPKIMDFGIAKLLTDNSVTRTGTQMGTPTYMSPEQVRDVKDIDKRSDIYSLGVTLFFMLTGAAPYNSTTLSTFDIYNKIVHEPLPPLTSHIQFNEIITKATAKNPDDRYSSCKAMADAFGINTNESKSPTEPTDDEKTLISTDEIVIPDKKKAFVKAKQVRPEVKPDPEVQQKKVKAEVIGSEGSRPRISRKQIVIGAATVLIIIAAFASYKMGVLGNSSRLSNSVDSVSYALGVIEGHYLAERFDTINLPALERGIMEASRYSTGEMADQKAMFKYSRNNLKNNQYDENECADVFRNYGSCLFIMTSQDMVFDLKNKLFNDGIKHVIKGQPLKISFDDAIAFSNSFPGSKSKLASVGNIAEEKAYFKTLKSNSNINKASNGVFYEVIRDGSGSMPMAKSNVLLKYNIKNLRGDVLKNDDGSYFYVSYLMPGWQEVVQKMKAGSLYRIYIPSNLAYGPLGIAGTITPYQALICEVEMVSLF